MAPSSKACFCRSGDRRRRISLNLPLPLRRDCPCAWGRPQEDKGNVHWLFARASSTLTGIKYVAASSSKKSQEQIFIPGNWGKVPEWIWLDAGSRGCAVMSFRSVRRRISVFNILLWFNSSRSLSLSDAKDSEWPQTSIGYYDTVSCSGMTLLIFTCRCNKQIKRYMFLYRFANEMYFYWKMDMLPWSVVRIKRTGEDVSDF